MKELDVQCKICGRKATIMVDDNGTYHDLILLDVGMTKVGNDIICTTHYQDIMKKYTIPSLRTDVDKVSSSKIFASIMTTIPRGTTTKDIDITKLVPEDAESVYVVCTPAVPIAVGASVKKDKDNFIIMLSITKEYTSDIPVTIFCSSITSEKAKEITDSVSLASKA